jgi:tetratricopeptide (TPR) repeat protein
MPTAGELSPDAAATMLELGVLCYRQGNLPAAQELLQKVVAFYRKARAAHSPDYHAASLALALDHLGIVTFYRSDEPTAISLLREALEISSTASLNDAERSVVTHNKSGLAFALINTGKLDEGEKFVNEAIAEYRQMPGPPRWEMGATLLFRSAAAVKRNRLDQAEADLHEGERILRRTLGDANTYLGWNLNQQAALYLLKNDLETAERRAREALRMFQSVSASGFPVAYALWTLGDVELKAGRADEAEQYHRQALSICEQESVQNYSWMSRIRAALSRSLVAQGRLDEAEQVATEGLEVARRHFGEEHLATQTAVAALANINQAREKAPAP